MNVAGTVDPKSPAGRAYNTTMAVMALRALGTKPKYDPLPVFDVVLKADYQWFRESKDANRVNLGLGWSF